MLDQKSYVYFIRKIESLEEIESAITTKFSKLMYDKPYISFDKYKELAFHILEKQWEIWIRI